MIYLINGTYYNGEAYSDSFTDLSELAQCILDINQLDIDFTKSAYRDDALWERQAHQVVCSDTLVITTEKD